LQSGSAMPNTLDPEAQRLLVPAPGQGRRKISNRSTDLPANPALDALSLELGLEDVGLPAPELDTLKLSRSCRHRG
jgi:hypothetical protein